MRTTLLLGGLTALVVVVAHVLGGTSWAIGALAVMAAMNFASWYYSDRIVVASRRPLRVGEIATVRIDRADAYDLHGTAVGF